MYIHQAYVTSHTCLKGGVTYPSLGVIVQIYLWCRYISRYICRYISRSICIYICRQICRCICRYICRYLQIHRHIYVCVYTYIYIYIYICICRHICRCICRSILYRCALWGPSCTSYVTYGHINMWEYLFGLMKGNLHAWTTSVSLDWAPYGAI